MTAALEGGEWSAASPSRTLHPGKTRYPLYWMLGGPQCRSERAEKLVPTGIRSRTVQSVVSRYTDWGTWPNLYTVLSDFWKSIAFWKISKLQRLLLLVRATCRWWWVWSTGGMIPTVEYQRILRKTCPRDNLSITNLKWKLNWAQFKYSARTSQ